jgi:hypothetical protein
MGEMDTVISNHRLPDLVRQGAVDLLILKERRKASFIAVIKRGSYLLN